MKNLIRLSGLVRVWVQTALVIVEIIHVVQQIIAGGATNYHAKLVP